MTKPITPPKSTIKRDPEPVNPAEVPRTDSHTVTVSLNRAACERLLGTLMSDISQRAYSARWITGTESVVPALAQAAVDTDTPQLWGQTMITVEEGDALLGLAAALDSWVTLASDDTYTPFPTLETSHE